MLYICIPCSTHNSNCWRQSVTLYIGIISNVYGYVFAFNKRVGDLSL